MYSNIRRAVSCDIPQLIEVWEESVRSTHDFLSENEIYFYKERIPCYLKEVEIYVYTDCNSHIKGFIGVVAENIEMLFVNKRGKGIGTMLLNFALEKLNAATVDVNEENNAAVGFYLSKEFSIVGRSGKDNEGKEHPIIHLKLKSK